MSAVLLDTNVFSYVLNKHALAALYDKHLNGKQQTLCFAVVADYFRSPAARLGAAKIAKLEESFRMVTIIPYDLGVCRAWASLCHAKNPDGSSRTFENDDRWIAACALCHDIPLVTHNRIHFEGIPGLKFISEAPKVPGG
jgi:predicted nucleic acid-binding protein